MALIKCSECGNQISSSAPSCPHCGYRKDTVLIEQSSKAIKKQQAGGCLILVIALVALMISLPMSQSLPDCRVPQLITMLSPLVAGLGLLILIVATIRRWWHHG